MQVSLKLPSVPMFSLVARGMCKGRLESIRTIGGLIDAGEVEAAVITHPGVSAVAVVGLPAQQGRGGEIEQVVACMIRVAAGWTWREECCTIDCGPRQLDLQTLREHCSRLGLLR